MCAARRFEVLILVLTDTSVDALMLGDQPLSGIFLELGIMKDTLTRPIKRGILCASLFFFAGCYSVTTRPDGGFKTATPPTFEQRQDFYLWGLVGEAHINTAQICKGQPAQLQSQRTFVDGLLGLITLGIYAPESARVWCK